MIDDNFAFANLARNPNMFVPWWMMAAYAYYIEDDPIISDEAFDYIADQVARRFRQLRHRHKWLIDQSNTKTAYYLTIHDYPTIIAGAVQRARHDARHRRVSQKIRTRV